MNHGVYIALVLTLLQIQLLNGVGKTTLGKLFLASYPGLPNAYDSRKLLPEVSFLLCTPSEKEIQVYMRTENAVGLAMIRLDFNLTSDHVQEYVPPGEYLGKATTGKKMTFRFHSLFDFAVSMFTMVDDHSASLVHLTSVASWGNSYVVFTLRENPAITVINFESENRLTILFRSESEDELETPNEIMVPGNKYRILLQKYESYSLSDCREVSKSSSWTGTSINGLEHFGVISGNCLSSATSVQCDNASIYYEDDISRDATAEMLMPSALYGKEFIAPNQPERRSPGYVVVVAGKPDTLVEHSVSNSGPKIDYFLRNEGDSIMLNDTLHATLITSNKGVQVFFIQRSKCREPGPLERGDASITVVVPVQLYYHSYHIYETWYPVVGKPPWQVSHVFLERGIHTLTTRVSFNYGCYVYGHSREVSYMSTVDYAVSGINNVCTRQLKYMEPGDYEDNDCDGEVDEELPDNIDNDMDSLIDEDLIDIQQYATTMGKYFVLAMPGMNGDGDHKHEPVFMLSLVTQVRGDAMVNVRSHPYMSLNTTVRVTADKSIFLPLQHTITPSFTGIRPTFIVSGNKIFGLMAMMHRGGHSMDILTAIPVDGWGTRYLAVTVGLTPSVVIIAQAPLQVKFHFRSATNIKNFFPPLGLRWVVDGNRVTVDLYSLLALEITTCLSSHRVTSLTGSEITGNVSFGVVSGSCREPRVPDECANQTEGDTKDYTAEMLIPEQIFGREFVVVSFNSHEHSGELIVVASEAGTVFQIARGHSLDSAGFILDDIGDWTSIGLPFHGALLTSNKPILTMQIYRASCYPHNIYRQTGDPSLGLLVPTTLFFYKYTWNVFSVILDTAHYATAVFSILQADEFRLNRHKLSIKTTEPVAGLKDWVTGTFRIGHPGLQMMESKVHAAFGLYVYALHNEVAYLSFVGFVLTTINRRCKHTTKFDCDFIDNDCDGRIDEELVNGEDDDFDKRNDEDICSNPAMRPTPWGRRSTTTVATSPTTAVLETSKIGTPPPQPEFQPSTPTSAIPSTVSSPQLHTTATDKIATDNTEATEKQSSESARVSERKLYIDVTAAKQDEKTDDSAMTTTPTDLELPFTPENDALGFAWWSEWKCPRNCRDPHMYRSRACNKNFLDDSMQCYGPTVEKRVSHCYVGVRCPTDCPKFTWGPGCQGSCVHCQEDCDPFFGNCSDCKAGFRFPSTGCSDTCGLFHYGFHCAEDCMAKCKSDCLERATGTCPKKSYFYLYPLWLLILVPLTLVVFISQRKTGKSTENRFAVELLETEQRSTL